MAEAGNAATRAGDVGWAVSGADGSFSLQVPDRAPSFLYFAAPTGWLIAREDIRDGVLFQQQLPTEPLEIPLRRGHLLRGRVLEPDGTTPAAGTRVTAGSAPPIVHNWGTAVARPDGTFEITVLAEVPGQLRAENPFGFGVADFIMPADGALEPVTIKLAALLALGGRVLDPDGSPVAGARVEAQGYPAGATNRFNRHEATTNERGVYTLEGIRPGRVVLVAHPPAGSDLARSAALDKEVALGGQYLDVDLTLAHSEEIEGLVVDGAGNPIEGATISWNRAITPAGVYTPTQPVTSDAAGRFRLTGLAAGERIEWLSASKEGYASASRMNYNALDGELRLVLEPGSLVVLTARDAATGQPITDYEYLVYAHAWTEYADGSPTRVTNAEGRAELAVTGQGGKRIVVAELGPDGRHTGRRGVARFTMRPGTIEVTAEVTGTRSVEGVVLDAQSREPIAGVFVEVSSNNQYGGRQTRRSPPGFAVEGSESDAQGRFRITGLVEGSYEIAASRLPVGRIITPPVEFEIERGIEPEPLEVLIGGGAAIVGRAIGADGKPMRGARIMMYHTRGQGGGTHNRTTDRNGNFELRPAVPGVWSVMLLSDATNGTAETRQVEVTGAGDAIVLFDFTGAVEVTGTVLVNGSPINSGELWGTFNRDDSRESRPIQPGPGGRYRALLQPGTHTITFSSRELQGMVVGRLEVPPGAPLRHDINLQLATLDIVLEAPGGAAVPAGNLAITAGANAAMRVFIEEGANRRHLPQIPAGVYTIEYTSRNGLLAGSESGVRVVVGQINAILIVVGEATGERAQLARAQQQLTNLGFDPGPVDGLMGPMTAGALRAFQQSRGLNPTGQLDEATRRALAAPAP
jgi:protocatechuate 3,4-dioxygenase beta subunit